MPKPDSMRAVVFDGELRVAGGLPIPIAAEGEALLKIRRAGICNTDLELIKGYKDFNGILGHEFVAELVAGPAELLGRHVVGEISVVCCDCEMCRRAIPSQCLNRRTVGIYNYPGAFADYLALPLRNLHVVPDAVSDDCAVFVEPLAANLQITEAVHISPRHRVVVIGAGKMGMLAAQVLRLTGADLSVIVRHDRQAGLLASWGIRAVLREEVANKSVDVVVDCTGVAEGFADALDIVKPRGTILLKSTYHGLPRVDMSRVVVDEIRVIGSRCGPFDAALRLLAAGLIDVESLIDGRYPLDDAVQAIEHASQRGVLKVLLDI
jgi:threonine dehydrogenase-like Zn-dependent dehydrogenase